MARKQAAKDQDKFVVRLPDGMRERIKAKADRAGMSMNEAVVYCLERYFPAPVTLERRVEELAELTAMLKQGENHHQSIARLVNEMHQTLADITDGKLPVAADFRRSVDLHLEEWENRMSEEALEENDNPFDDGRDLDED